MMWRRVLQGALLVRVLEGPQLSARTASTPGRWATSRITALGDLPSKARITALIKQAMKLNDSGVKRVVRKKSSPKPPLRVPADFTAALRGNAAAAAAFKDFSPSARREYVEWVTEAKAAATRERQLATAIGWIAEGKRRNWQYESR